MTMVVECHKLMCTNHWFITVRYWCVGVLEERTYLYPEMTQTSFKWQYIVNLHTTYKINFFDLDLGCLIHFITTFLISRNSLLLDLVGSHS